RELRFEEWELSQAWQAFSAYEAIRKKRWLGYDGFAWCTLRGGGNNGTYMKPLTDYYGTARWRSMRWRWRTRSGSPAAGTSISSMDQTISFVLLFLMSAQASRASCG